MIRRSTAFVTACMGLCVGGGVIEHGNKIAGWFVVAASVWLFWRIARAAIRRGVIL